MNVVLFFLILSHQIVFGSIVSWITDEIDIGHISRSAYSSKGSTISAELKILSNGPIYTNDRGHFRFQLFSHAENFSIASACFSVGASDSQISSLIRAIFTVKAPNLTGTILSSLVDVDSLSVVARKATAVNASSGDVLTIHRVSISSKWMDLTHLNITIDAAAAGGCAPLRTVADWGDKRRWSTGSPPGAQDDVVFPLGTGVVRIANDVTIGTLKILGGTLQAYSSSCPLDWSISPINKESNKCYKLFEDSLDFYNAEEKCVRAGRSSSTDAHLVHVQSPSQLEVVKGICRGPPGSVVRTSGCWIGLRKQRYMVEDDANKIADTVDDLVWVGGMDTGTSFPRESDFLITAEFYGNIPTPGYRDWKRRQPDNHTSSEGFVVSHGKRCVALTSWQDDPMTLEAGSWIVERCDLRKPFVCEMAAPSKRISFIVLRSAKLLKGVLEGGYWHLIGKDTVISDLTLTRSATLFLGQSRQKITGSDSLPAKFNYIYPALFGDISGGLTQTNLRAASPRSVLSEADVIVIGDIVALDGSSIVVSASLLIYQSSLIGEPLMSQADGSVPDVSSHLNNSTILPIAADPQGIAPILVITGNASIVLSANCSAALLLARNVNASMNRLTKVCAKAREAMVSFNLRSIVRGSVFVGSRSKLIVLQQSDISQASVEFVGAAAAAEAGAIAVAPSVVFGADSVKMHVWDSFTLTMSHFRPIIGVSVTNMSHLQQQQHHIISGAVYRLRVSDMHGVSEITPCVPYNATCAELSAILNTSLIIVRRGGVRVRRYGDHRSSAFNFGYTYRIDIDASPTSAHNDGPLDISLFCAGTGSEEISSWAKSMSFGPCGCAKTMVPLQDFTGTQTCPRPGRVSPVNLSGCVLSPSIQVHRVSQLSYAQFSTNGSYRETVSRSAVSPTLILPAGTHRIAPVVAGVRVELRGTSIGIVSASVSLIGLVSVGDESNLVVAGAGWAGWDDATVLDTMNSPLLYTPLSLAYNYAGTEIYGDKGKRHTTQPFVMNSSVVSVYSAGRILFTTPGSRVNWNSAYFFGGVLGGKAHLYIAKALNVTTRQIPSALRYGLSLYIDAGAKMSWIGGDIGLAEGSSVSVSGVLTIGNSSRLPSEPAHQTIGQVNLIFGSGNASASLLRCNRATDLFNCTRSRSDLRNAWDGEYDAGSRFLVLQHARIEVLPFADASFRVPLFLNDSSTLHVLAHGKLTLWSGGAFGPNSSTLIDIDAVLILAGGNVNIASVADLQGTGELLVWGGSHFMPALVDVHVTVSGGEFVWPDQQLQQGSSRINNAVWLRRGLVVCKSGRFIVRPYTTTVNISSTLGLRDTGLIQFPAIGTATQTTSFDAVNDDSSSLFGDVDIRDVFYFEGGQLSGAARFWCHGKLIVDGDDRKWLRALSQLRVLSYGEWIGGSGDLILSGNAQLINTGDIQYPFTRSPAVYNEGSVDATREGDEYIQSFHDWDEDPGALDYSDYISSLERAQNYTAYSFSSSS